MTIKLSSLRADLAREAKGDWVDYPDWPGVRFKVSSLYTPSYVVARDVLLGRLARVNKGKPPKTDALTTEMGVLYAEHILHDWDGLDEAYSPERAREVLCDPAFREVTRAVEWCAQQVGTVEAEFLEDARPN